MKGNRPHPRPRIRLSGYTLLEMVIASASAAILIGGLASSLYIATQSLDVSSGSLAEARTAQEIITRINDDLQSAVSLSELTATAVTMNVPDRNGDNVPEVIRYSWSGGTSDPLQITYNGTTSNLASNVQSFSLEWISRLIKGHTAFPIVLFVSSQAPDGSGGGIAVPSTTEQDRIDLMRGWGYDVTVISQQATQDEFNTEFTNSTVIYVSGECNGGTIGTKLNTATLGVVTESYDNSENLGFYTLLLNFDTAQTEIEITSTPHYITENFSAGNLAVTTTAQQMKWTSSLRAPDSVPLATVSPLLITYPTLLILDAGDELVDGNTAAGRRCQLPWGESSFDVTTLTADGQTIMQRSLEWAAGIGDDIEATVNVVYHELTELKEEGGANSADLVTPAGTTEGDLLVAVMFVDGDDTLNAPSGWTEIASGLGNSRVAVGVWWKIAGSSESSTHNFNWAGTEQYYGLMMRFTGHDPASPIDSSNLESGSSSSPNSPAVSTSVDNCMIVRVGGFDDDDITIGTTGLTDHTTIVMDENKVGTGTVSGGVGYAIQATAGDSGTDNFTLTGSEENVTITFAIQPDQG